MKLKAVSLLLTASVSTIILVLALVLIIPSHVFGQSNKAMTLYNAGNFTGAAKLLNDELVTQPHGVKILLDIALSYDGAGNHSAAMFYYNKIIKEVGSNQQYATQKAWALDGLGDYVNALKFFKQGLKNNERDVFAPDGLGHTMIALKQYTNASLTFGRVLSLPIPKLEQQPGYVEALASKAVALLYLKNNTGSLFYTNQALQLRPTDPSIYYNKGYVLQKMGDYVGTIEAYDKVLRITPNDKDTMFLRKLAIQSLEAQVSKGAALNDQGKGLQR